MISAWQWWWLQHQKYQPCQQASQAQPTYPALFSIKLLPMDFISSLSLCHLANQLLIREAPEAWHRLPLCESPNSGWGPSPTHAHLWASANIIDVCIKIKNYFCKGRYCHYWNCISVPMVIKWRLKPYWTVVYFSPKFNWLLHLPSFLRVSAQNIQHWEDLKRTSPYRDTL